MKTTTSTNRSFRAAVLAALSTDSATWPQPVIYAQEIDGEMIFDACNAPAMPQDAIPWMHVESDSFGDLTGDHEADSHAIECNMFDQAANDTLDELDRREM
jgi:hypothetical protein